MNPYSNHFFSLNGRSRVLVPSMIVAIALTGTLSILFGAEPLSSASWRQLPLITDGRVDSSWVHTGWGGFAVDNGALRTECDPKGLGLLIYQKERFGNCQIRVVFKSAEAKSNAGVYVRIADGILEQVGKTGEAFDRDADGNPSAESLERVKSSAERGEGPWFAVHHGYEVQIAEGTDPFHRTGAIYSLAPSSAGSEKAPGEWKTMIITLDRDQIFVDLDGKRITSFDPGSPNVPPQKEWYEPKREPKRPQAGYIGLQNHDPGDVVWYKEVSVRHLSSALAPVPAALGVPAPGPTTDGPYAPQPIVQGGIVIPLYPPDSPHLNKDRVREAEVYNMSRAVPGRISSIVNIHNPSIEVHKVEGSINTGAAIILVAGGGHNTLNVGTESADFVPFFYNYGVNTIILRNRLRRDGYNVQADAVNDSLQAIRLVRAYAKEWNIDPNKIGIVGFSAGAELAAPAAILFDEFDQKNNDASDPLAGISSRPDFVGLIYPGPTPFARNANPSIPRNAPPAFITSGGSGDRAHALWATEYCTAMLRAGIPNVEMHIYGNGRHPGDRMSGGLTDRNGIPFGTWKDRYIDWFRDLGFLRKPDVETKAARDITAFQNRPQQGFGRRRGSNQ